MVDIISEKAKDYLRQKYGDHPYNYEMSDYNLKSILSNNTPQTFDELDKRARDLEAVIKHIQKMQEDMQL